MATYKQPCIHCGEFIERDSRLCSRCGSRSPFGYSCPSCLKTVERNQALCSGCGKPLNITCPYCGQTTFVSEKCGVCGKSLMIACENKRCGQLQHFENKLCTACGKSIDQKSVQKQMKQIREGQ